MDLDSLYRLFEWPEDPGERAFLERTERARGHMDILTSHPWIRGLGEEVRLLDLCSGTGIGGAILADRLIREGKKVYLTLADLREDALRKAGEWIPDTIGVKPKLVRCRAEEVHRFISDQDLCLIYGLSIPHFNPWNCARMLASVSSVSNMAVIEVMDYYDWYFRTIGYKYLLPERGEGKVTLHQGYDHLRGVYRRKLISLLTGESADMEVSFWSLSSLGTLMWMFYRDVDFIELERISHRGFLIGRDPRGRITPTDLEKDPSIVRENTEM